VAGGDIAAIINPYNLHEVHGRKIIISPRNKPVSDYVDILSSEYEPLQYLLLFPNGSTGWPRGNLKGMTQAWWYRYRLLCEDRFDFWGRLACEYIVDIYSRIEEERLAYIKEGELGSRSALQMRCPFVEHWESHPSSLP